MTDNPDRFIRAGSAPSALSETFPTLAEISAGSCSHCKSVALDANGQDGNFHNRQFTWVYSLCGVCHTPNALGGCFFHSAPAWQMTRPLLCNLCTKRKIVFRRMDEEKPLILLGIYTSSRQNTKLSRQFAQSE
jgi:hypothetical protein